MRFIACALFVTTVSLAHADWPSLPERISNNAFTAVASDDGAVFISFAGIGSGLTYRDVHSKTFVLYPGASSWTRVADIPGERGRLASVAVGIGSKAYVFGGYSLAADGSEISERDSYEFDPRTARFRRIADMPVAVDDAVALSYRDRFIYLISGWHDVGNVNLVQRYDIETDSWTQATPWPGSPVFGHAGAIVGDQLLVCDGVRISNAHLPRRFVSSSECFLGRLDTQDLRRIHWQSVPPHPGLACYRMGAIGMGDQNEVLFFGGGDNPYNYDGIGYDRTPAKPCRRPFVFSLNTKQWRLLPEVPDSRMDQRGLVLYGKGILGLGGMSSAGQQESSLSYFEY